MTDTLALPAKAQRLITDGRMTPLARLSGDVQPLAAYEGDRPGNVDDGYDFMEWAEARGLTALYDLGEWPYVVVAVAGGDQPVSLTYTEGDLTLAVWPSRDAAETALPALYPVRA